MNSSNLETAASYINNLLLARGLLRNGQPLELAHPSRGEGGKEMTMARIVTLIHDLILRRDRESDNLSTLSRTLTSLKASSAQQVQTISRLENRASDLERQLTQALTGEKATRAALGKSDGRNKVLREETARLKVNVGQIRAQCANDVRKREGEIRRLQKHLEGKRGKEGPVGVTVVQPGGHCLKIGSNGFSNGYATDSDEYVADGGPLRAEANGYLTQLAQALGEENEGYNELLRDTVNTLRHLQGLPESNTELHRSERNADDPDATIMTTATAEGEADPNIALSNPPTLPLLASSLNFALSHLRNLLTNPSFVPLEEVEVRDEEISRLREGWDKMEARWREAIGLMNEWRQRMSSGDTVKLEDLRKGLVLGNEEIIAPPSVVRRERTGSGRGQDESFISEATDASVLLVPYHDQTHEDEEDTPKQKNEKDSSGQAVKATTATKKPSPKLGIGLLPAPQILQATTGNARKIMRTSPSKCQQGSILKANSPQVRAMIESLDSDGGFDELALLETLPGPMKKRRISNDDDEAENALLDLIPSPQLQPEPQSPARATAYKLGPLEPDAEAAEEKDDEGSEEDETPFLSIEEKLALAQKEAEEASAALKAAMTGDASEPSISTSNATGSSSAIKVASSPTRTKSNPRSTLALANLSRRNSTKTHIAAVGPSSAAVTQSTEKPSSQPEKPKSTSDRGKENNPPSADAEPVAAELQDQNKTKRPVKRSQVPKRILTGKAGMKRSKRRSTLSPEELEGLVGL